MAYTASSPRIPFKQKVLLFLKAFLLAVGVILASAFWSFLHALTAIFPRVLKHGLSVRFLYSPFFLSIAFIAMWFYINLPHKEGPLMFYPNLRTLLVNFAFFMGWEYQKIATAVVAVLFVTTSYFYDLIQITKQDIDTIRTPDDNGNRISSTRIKPENRKNGVLPLPRIHRIPERLQMQELYEEDGLVSSI